MNQKRGLLEIVNSALPLFGLWADFAYSAALNIAPTVPRLPFPDFTISPDVRRLNCSLARVISQAFLGARITKS